MGPWRVPESPGRRSGTCGRTGSPCCWSTPATSKLCRDARRMRAAVRGWERGGRDGEWLAELLRHGLLTGSFVPERPQRELRELTRYRTSLIRERSAEINRVQKTLEGANIKLGDVASNVLGVSGRQILTALVSGTADPTTLADFARGKLRSKLP